MVPETIPDLKKWKKEVGTAGIEIINKGIAMSINDDETMLVLTNQNIIMLIRDRALCEVLKQLVDAYYDNTKEIDI